MVVVDPDGCTSRVHHYPVAAIKCNQHAQCNQLQWPILQNCYVCLSYKIVMSQHFHRFTRLFTIIVLLSICHPTTCLHHIQPENYSISMHYSIHHQLPANSSLNKINQTAEQLSNTHAMSVQTPDYQQRIPSPTFP